MSRSHHSCPRRKGEGLDKVLPKGTYEESTRVFACALMQNCLLDKVRGGRKQEGLCCGDFVVALQPTARGSSLGTYCRALQR